MKYISGEVSEVNIENVFGALSIYFMDAVPAEGSINVRVESVFGSVTLYVPSSWNVRVNVQRVLGSSGARGRWEPDGVYEMYVGGDAVFGEVKVIYV